MHLYATRRKNLQSLAAFSVLLTGLAAGCRHQPEPATAWVPAAQSAPVLALAATDLADEAAMGRLIDAYSLTGAEVEGLQVLVQTAKELPKARLQSDAKARRVVALAVYRTVRGANLSERFEAIRALVDALQAASPDAPETVFCRAFLRYVLLQDDGKRLAAGSLERGIIADLARDLAVLVEQHPTFDGPGDWPRGRLAFELQRVRQLLVSLPAVATPAGATPTDAGPAPAATATGA